MANLSDLEHHSDIFFKKHWDRSSSILPPIWICNWSWVGSVPYHNKSGVYALFDEDGNVAYVGLGASRGGGPYVEHGISRRLLAHVITPDKSKGRNAYKPKDSWTEITDIGALGFESEYSYLAPALEDYLIGILNPPRNSMKKRKA